ncbi:MAG TPA: hypothetical protein VMU25_03285 [Candidatus Paceibacterota bacterium]|nr:hypothetical protein [Candidatus Paceibacterota bacterium]
MFETQRLTSPVDGTAAGTIVIYHECDQIASDLIETQDEMFKEYGVIITPQLYTAESLIETLVPFYPCDDFEELLEYTLDRHEPFLHEMERKGYKRFLGKFFGRRGAFAREQRRKHSERLDAPF